MAEYTFANNLMGSRVDATNGVILGVAVITEGLANGEIVDATTLQQIMQCAKTYENGLKVKADHRSGIFDVAGFLRNFRIEGKTLRADLYILSTETNKAKLLEMAATIPDTFGLSVSFSGPQTVMAGQSFARCTEIYSADLVSEPAANPTGLFEKRQIDGSRKDNSMATPPADAPEDAKVTPSQLLKQCQEMIAKGFSDHQANFAKMISDAMSTIKPALPTGDPAAGFTPDKQAEHAKLITDLKEMSLKLAATESDLKEFKTSGVKITAEAVAKEFAKELGKSPAVLAAITTGLQEQEKQGADKFVELAVKHYTAQSQKDKVKAMTMAMTEAPEAYGVFRASGKNIIWPKTA